MPASITPSLRAAIERLKHAGSISGICLGWRRQILLNLTPYQDFRIDRLLDLLHDARDHFRSSDRQVDTFWFGFDGVFLLSVAFHDCNLVLLHTRAHEVDFLKSAALTLLDDCQLLVNALLNPSDDAISGMETEKMENPEEYSGQETNLIPRNG
jgi:hypothetical protein